jgi:hypothetical protein
MMNNYKLVYAYDGYKFYDVVNAESLDTAFEYLKWITDDDVECKLIRSESKTTDEVATFYCPEGWVKPENVEHARRRSLMTALANAGITNTDVYSDELDNTMKAMGYTATNDTIDSLYSLLGKGKPTKVIKYTRTGAANLTVKVKQ